MEQLRVFSTSWQPTPVLLPGKSHGWKSLEAAVHGVAMLDTTGQLHFHFSLSCIGEGNGNPLQCSCLENPRDGGAWWAAIYGVAQSRTQLKWLSSSSFIAAANVKTCNWHIGMKSYLPVPLWKDRQVAGVEVWFQSGARKHLRWLERPGFESYFCSSFRILWVSFTHSIALYLLTWSKLNICTLWVDVED